MDDDCVFCDIIHKKSRPLDVEGDEFVAFRDKFPVSEGHTLVVPRRHWTTLTEMSPTSGEELIDLLQKIKSQLIQEFNPDGFNVGLNDGTTAGQTIDHLHWHVIPRYRGDVSDPEGGVRGVIPDEQQYR